MTKTVKITYSRNPDAPSVQETIELTGEKVGHRFEQTNYPVITIWANNENVQHTVSVVNPVGAIVTMTN